MHNKKKQLQLKKVVIDEENEHLLHMYLIQSFPTLLLIKNDNERIYYQSDSREKEKINSFLRENRVI